MSKKILVMGGCHVEGYNVGRENSFVELFSRYLYSHNINNEIVIQPSFLIKNPDMLKYLCEIHRPDVLILQVGNYDFSPNFKKRIKKMLLRKVISGNIRSSNKITIEENIYRGDVIYQPDIITRSRIVCKDIITKALNFPFLDMKMLTSKTEILFNSIAANCIPEVIVLSALPCPDNVTLKYRIKGSQMLEEISKKYNFQYLNILSAFIPHKDIYSDIAHLNTKGHNILGNYIGNYYVNEMKK